MKKTMYLFPLVAVLLFSSCSRVLYDATDIHYVERCGEQSCEQTLARLTSQCKGEVIEAGITRGSVIVHCRPATPVKSSGL